MVRKCGQCGEEFETEDKRRGYCSPECSLAAKRARTAEAWRRANPPGIRTISCLDCQVEFEAQRNDALRCADCRRKNGNVRRGAFEVGRKHPCGDCGQPCSYRSPRCKACSNKFKNGLKMGALNPAWKGGRVQRKRDGYIELRIDGRKVLEHRHVWEQAHGPIPPKWQVHHLNGLRDDNRLENLVAMSASDHHSDHHGAWQARIRDLEAQLRAVAEG